MKISKYSSGNTSTHPEKILWQMSPSIHIAIPVMTRGISLYLWNWGRSILIRKFPISIDDQALQRWSDSAEKLHNARSLLEPSSDSSASTENFPSPLNFQNGYTNEIQSHPHHLQWTANSIDASEQKRKPSSRRLAIFPSRFRARRNLLISLPTYSVRVVIRIIMSIKCTMFKHPGIPSNRQNLTTSHESITCKYLWEVKRIQLDPGTIWKELPNRWKGAQNRHYLWSN